MQKMNFMPQIVLEILKLKKSCNSICGSILAYNLRSRFSDIMKTCSFHKIIKNTYGVSLKGCYIFASLFCMSKIKHL